MNYPALLLVPIFMLLDYFLTIAGRIQHKKEYAKRFKVESYELNPGWQSDIENTRWFNPRHMGWVLVITIVFVWFLEVEDVRRSFAEFALGVVLVLYGTVVGRHLANLALFTALVKNPRLASGQVAMSQKLVLLTSLWQTCAVLVPLLAILVISPSAAVAGGVFGTVFLMMNHLVWLRQAKNRAPEPDEVSST
jgi:hypothetical protein